MSSNKNTLDVPLEVSLEEVAKSSAKAKEMVKKWIYELPANSKEIISLGKLCHKFSDINGIDAKKVLNEAVTEGYLEKYISVVCPDCGYVLFKAEIKDIPNILGKKIRCSACDEDKVLIGTENSMVTYRRTKKKQEETK